MCEMKMFSCALFERGTELFELSKSSVTPFSYSERSEQFFLDHSGCQEHSRKLRLFVSEGKFCCSSYPEKIVHRLCALCAQFLSDSLRSLWGLNSYKVNFCKSALSLTDNRTARCLRKPAHSDVPLKYRARPTTTSLKRETRRIKQ